MRVSRRPSIDLRPIRRFGDAALQIETESASEAAELAMAVRSKEIVGVIDAVSGARSVLLRYEPTQVQFDELCKTVGSIEVPPTRWSGRKHIFDTVFDGPDLHHVGEMTGLGADGVRVRLLNSTLRVAFLGFAPGFAYLSGLPQPLQGVGRRATPRPVVPAGSLALGGGHAAVYPQASPGGWQIVGRTRVQLFDPERAPHALVAPGDIVRLREVDPGELAQPAQRLMSVSAVGGEPAFVVKEPGFYTTFQDRGRPGFAHLGVPGSGAADRVSFDLANALVGNPPGSTCLEITGSGPRLLASASTHFAVVGTGVDVVLDERMVGAGRVIPVTSGQILRVSSTGWSLRAYLAVRGGFNVAEVLGSCSTDRLSGLGPAPLSSGDVLSIGLPPGPMSDHLRPGGPGQLRPSFPRVLRVLPTQGNQLGLFERPFEVDQTSDRIGLRLRALERTWVPPSAGELPSTGMTVGAVQVPPSGDPIVLLSDHATVGGYSVGAVVISADLAELGRCRPGDVVQLVPVHPDEALEALLSLRRSVSDALVGAYPTRSG